MQGQIERAGSQPRPAQIMRAGQAHHHALQAGQSGHQCRVHSSGEGHHSIISAQLDCSGDGLVEVHQRISRVHLSHRPAGRGDLSRRAASGHDAEMISGPPAVPLQEELAAECGYTGGVLLKDSFDLLLLQTPPGQLYPAPQRKIHKLGYAH